MGAIPSDSDFAFDSAEYFGRRAAVRNSRSLVGFTAGFRFAALKIFTAHSNQEIGAPPPKWIIPSIPFSTSCAVRSASAGANVGEAT